jgi:hypothetical protein
MNNGCGGIRIAASGRFAPKLKTGGIIMKRALSVLLCLLMTQD